MPFSIQPMTVSDLPAVTEMVAASKFDLSINRLLWKNWPDHERQRAQYGNAVAGGLKNSASELFKAVDDGTGDIVGHMVLTRKPAATPKQSSDATAAVQEIPDQFDADVLTTVMNGVSELEKETEHLDQLNVVFIVVRKDQRRKGIGSQLLNIAFDRARAAEIPIVTQSEPAAYKFFKNHGFQDTKSVDWDLSKFTTPHSGFGMFRLAGIIWCPGQSGLE